MPVCIAADADNYAAAAAVAAAADNDDVDGAYHSNYDDGGSD